MHVELEAVDAEGMRPFEGGPGVFRRQSGSAAMRENHRAAGWTRPAHPSVFRLGSRCIHGLIACRSHRVNAARTHDSIAGMASHLPMTLRALRRAVETGHVRRRPVRT